MATGRILSISSRSQTIIPRSIRPLRDIDKSSLGNNLLGIKKNGYASYALPTPSNRSRDLIWIIGSASFFVPAMIYFLSPTSPKHTSISNATGDFNKPNHKSIADSSNTFEEGFDHKNSNLIHHPSVSQHSDPPRAGEGRPHGQGDKALRKMMAPVDSFAGVQSSKKDPEDFKAIPEKMDEARTQASKDQTGSTSVSTKNISDKAHQSHDEKRSEN